MTAPALDATIVEVGRVEARLVAHEWDWAIANQAAIAANWARRTADKPALFDGPVLMSAGTERDGDTLRARFFETRYSGLLAHADGDFPDPTVANGFAMGALQGADGAYVLGIMAAGTANAGRLYFPAGTPDRSDLRPDGTVDLAGSIAREIAEETGLAPSDYALGPRWTVVRQAGRLAFLRPARLRVTAEAAAARIRRHLASEPEPELAAVRVLRDLRPDDEALMPTFLPAYLRWAMSRPG